jgi:hypothetical protein
MTDFNVVLPALSQSEAATNKSGLFVNTARQHSNECSEVHSTLWESYLNHPFDYMYSRPPFLNLDNIFLIEFWPFRYHVFVRTSCSSHISRMVSLIVSNLPLSINHSRAFKALTYVALPYFIVATISKVYNRVPLIPYNWLPRETSHVSSC